MSHPGKQMRLKRVIEPTTGTSVICALDHGMTRPHFLSGLFDTGARLRETQAGGANVIMMSRGFYRMTIADFQPATSLALLLTASASGAPAANIVTPIGEVEEALRIGADCVVTYVALHQANEAEMITRIAAVGAECERLGMPWIAEAEFPTTYASLEALQHQYGFDYLMRNCRLCAELGADIVKTNWPGGGEKEFEQIVRATRVPMVVAGGSRVTDAELLERMEQGMRAGAIGCSVGRNIFQHEHPEAMTRALSRVIKERWSAAQALEELTEAVAARRRQAAMCWPRRASRAARLRPSAWMGMSMPLSRWTRPASPSAPVSCGWIAGPWPNAMPLPPASVRRSSSPPRG